MGELQTEPFQFTFNGFLKVAFQGSRIPSDAGLIFVRELDERLGLARGIAAHQRDSRHGLHTQFRLPDLLRQSVYSRLAGYEDLNDAVRLAADPIFRLIGSPTRWDRSAALTSTLQWFETELLTREEHLVGVMAVNRDLIGRAETCDGGDRVVRDMDSSESPVFGQQEGSAYNGHFASLCYHPRMSWEPGPPARHTSTRAAWRPQNLDDSAMKKILVGAAAFGCRRGPSGADITEIPG